MGVSAHLDDVNEANDRITELGGRVSTIAVAQGEMREQVQHLSQAEQSVGRQISSLTTSVRSLESRFSDTEGVVELGARVKRLAMDNNASHKRFMDTAERADRLLQEKIHTCADRIADHDERLSAFRQWTDDLVDRIDENTNIRDQQVLHGIGIAAGLTVAIAYLLGRSSR